MTMRKSPALEKLAASHDMLLTVQYLRGQRSADKARIAALEKQVEDLKAERDALRAENEELLDWRPTDDGED